MRTHYSRGVIGTIVLIIVALIILGYFGIDIKTALSGPIVQENLRYAWQLVMTGLHQGLAQATDFIQAHTGINLH